MFGTSAPRGPGRGALPVFVLVGLGLMPGCASTRGPISTPSGPRWLGPADPIAASRPPAVTFDPYQGAAPESSPGGLARYFPGQRAGQSASPALRQPAGLDPGPTLAANDPAAEPPPGPRRASARGPAALLGQDTALAETRPHSAAVEALPVALALETYDDPPGPSDPDTRLVSQRLAEPATEPSAPLIEGPGDLPDFGALAAEPSELPTADQPAGASMMDLAEEIPPVADLPGAGATTAPAIVEAGEPQRRPGRLRGFLDKLKARRAAIGHPLFGRGGGDSEGRN